MKSHAKASSAGSTQRQVGRLLISFSILTLGLFIALTAGTAFAKESHVFSGAIGSGKLSLAEHSGLAVNQTTHNIYVADTGNGSVAEFEPNGTFVRAFGSLTTPTFISVDNSGGSSQGDLYVADSADNSVSKFEADGTAVTSWGTLGKLGGFEPLAGIAVGPTGSLYVIDGSSGTHQYSAEGVELSSFEAPRGTAFFGLAADTEDNLYKIDGIPNVTKFSNTGENLSNALDAREDAVGLGIDPAQDDLYVLHSGEGGLVNRFAVNCGEECTPLEVFGAGELSGPQGVAVDGSTHAAYVTEATASEVDVFAFVDLPDATTEAAEPVAAHSATLHGTISAAGGPEAACEFQYTTEEAFQSEGFENATSVACSPPGPFTGSGAEAVSAAVNGLTPATEYRFRIVGSSENGSEPGQALGFLTTGPAIVSQSVEAVGVSDATVSARINPKGEPTTYHVEYGPTASYGQSTAESLPIGFESDESLHTVSVHIDNLAAGGVHHFRFVATNPAGTTEGADVTFATYSTTPSFGSCSNDAFRTGFGAHLSDCRAYEQATPVDKHGANIQGSVGLVQAASAGDRITFNLNGGLATTGGSSSLSAYMASRGPAGWSSDGLLPSTDPGPSALIVGWSDDLSTTAVTAPGPGNVGGALYFRDSNSATFQLGPAGVGEGFLAGFAADASHLIFESVGSTLAPGAVPGEFNLYDLDHGVLTLPGRIPSGSATSCDDVDGPACVPAPEGAFAGPYNLLGTGCPSNGGASCLYYTQNTISRDGSRVLFTTRGSRQLYVRENAIATTQISASQAATLDPNGEKPAAFMAATPDGSKVFFTSCEKLTDDSTAVSTAVGTCTTASQGQDLYSYDTGSGELTDLTVDSNVSDLRGAAVQGVLGASDDGSYVYFVAKGALAPGASAVDCNLSSTCNLYVYHAGAVTFVASLESLFDTSDWASLVPQLDQKDSRVSADGRTVLFSSTRSITGYDSTETTANACGSGTARPCAELFRYSAPDNELTCVSCNPTGVSPRGNAVMASSNASIVAVAGSGQTFLTRNLSADGNRVFFESPDALLPTDTNGVGDVYEWEAEGTGSCATEGGCTYLLSSGNSPDLSYFGDASTDGDHVFIFTDQQLVPTDHDQLYDVYDVGVGDGLASQHTLAPPTCTGTACQANPAPPPDQTMASAAFSGPGNAHRPPAARKCPKGKRKVRSAGKVHCQKAHKQHKRHTNRGGSK